MKPRRIQRGDVSLSVSIPRIDSSHQFSGSYGIRSTRYLPFHLRVRHAHGTLLLCGDQLLANNQSPSTSLELKIWASRADTFPKLASDFFSAKITMLLKNDDNISSHDAFLQQIRPEKHSYLVICFRSIALRNQGCLFKYLYEILVFDVSNC